MNVTVGDEVNGWKCIEIIDTRALGLREPVPPIAALWKCLSCPARYSTDVEQQPKDHESFHRMLKRVETELWHDMEEEHSDA